MSVLYYSVDKMWSLDWFVSFGQHRDTFRLVNNESYWLVPGTYVDD